MGEKLLQGENGGPVIFLQLDALFPGLPERRLWLAINWCMRKMFGSIHLFLRSRVDSHLSPSARRNSIVALKVLLSGSALQKL